MRNAVTLSLILLLFALLLACETPPDPLERGELLVTTLDCDTCHSPKLQGPDGIPVLGPGGILIPDSSRRLSGHPADAPYPTWSPADFQRHSITLASPALTAWAGPWGVSFAINLTPDKATGLGEWTEEAFIQAIRSGKHQGQPNGRDILPPMPWFAYRHLPDEDLKAIWAYLRTLPPVENQVPLPVPPTSPPKGD